MQLKNLLALLPLLLAARVVAAATSCADLAHLTVPNVTIQSATDVAAGELVPAGAQQPVYTGWADPVVPPMDVVSYYEAVTRTMGGLRKTREFFRFFGIPGMGHCGGGYGPKTIDVLSALEAWVEHGRAPERLIAPREDSGAPPR